MRNLVINDIPPSYPHIFFALLHGESLRTSDWFLLICTIKEETPGASNKRLISNAKTHPLILAVFLSRTQREEPEGKKAVAGPPDRHTVQHFLFPKITNSCFMKDYYCHAKVVVSASKMLQEKHMRH